MSDKSKPLTLAERLNATGNKLAELSKKVSDSTKTAVGNANESIKNAISENKQKRDAKRQKKLEEARVELSSEGLLDDVPSMVTLPEFEQNGCCFNKTKTYPCIGRNAKVVQEDFLKKKEI